jgi:hypothetical protein
VSEILAGVDTGKVVEDYPDYPKGRSVLVLQMDGAGRAIHVVGGGSRKLRKPSRVSHGVQARPNPMGRTIHGATKVTLRRKTKYIHEGQFVAEVEVEVIEDESSWSPYLSVTDATRLD